MPKTILLAEDEAALAMNEARMLKNHGFEVIIADSGEKAIEKVKACPHISLILMDIAFGDGIDGAEAARRILEEHDLPIVFLSSHTDPEVVDRTKGIASYGYVVKNSGETVLLASVNMALELFEAKADRGQTEEQLKERVKELNCLYTISKTVEEPNSTLEGILQKTADTVPASWRCPEIAVCRITLYGKEYRSEGFRVTDRLQSSALRVNGNKVGSVEVYYVEDRPVCDEGPFTKEERQLIDAVAERLGRIIERRQAEEELKTSRNLLDATQRIARVGGWEWDVARQTMTWTDQTYLIHGFESGEVAAGSPEYIQRSLACYDPDDRPKIEEAFRKCVEEGEAYTLEFPLNTSHGRRIWVQTSAQAVLEGGKVVKVQGHIMDITERKELEKLKEHINRITWHDIKSPLNGVLGIPQILMEDENLTDTQREYLQMILDSGHRVLNMITLSHAIYQIEQGTYEYSKEQFDLLQLIRQCVTENETLWTSKNIEIVISTGGFDAEDPETITAAGEKLLAYSVVSNLLKNAVEASPAGGPLNIEISYDHNILLSLHNHGAVPRNIRDTFFDKYTTSGKKGGTGLGTYSAKLFAEAQGWSIEMRTSEEEGTTLTLTIPGYGK